MESTTKHVDVTFDWSTSCRLLITSLSIGKDAGVVALEGVVKKTFSKALEDHLLTCTQTHVREMKQNAVKCELSDNAS